MKLGTALRYIPGSELFITNEEIEYYNSLGIKMLLMQLINAIGLITGAYMFWMGFGSLCRTDAPIVVVISESMCPGFAVGDILFLSMWKKEIAPGDICVFQLQKNDIPIVHRAISITQHKTSKTRDMEIITKGDNNRADDIGLYYSVGKRYLERNDILMYAYATIPMVGLATIIANKWKILKYVVLVLLFGSVFLSKEEHVIKYVNEKKDKKNEVDKKKDNSATETKDK
ncbi:signal peptidase I [Nematocida sp. AWRm80]|nr:signal peptidase I [Nematocida sp. AWRm80]